MAGDESASVRHVLAVDDDGLKVTLDDGSMWSVSPGYNTMSILWYPTMRVRIARVGEGAYPFTLTNLDTSGPDVVAARRDT